MIIRSIKNIFKTQPDKYYNLLVVSIYLYALTFSVGVVVWGKSPIYHITQLFFGFACLFCTLKVSRHNRRTILDKPAKWFITLLLLWNAILVFRGLMDDPTAGGVARMILYPSNFFFYIIPFYALLYVDENRLRILFKWWIVSILISCVLLYAFRNVFAVTNLAELNDFASDDISFYNILNLSGIVSSTVMSIGFFAIYNRWNTRIEKLFVYIMIGVGIVTIATLGRRGGVVSVLILIAAMVVMSMREKPRQMVLFILISIFAISYIASHLDEIMSYFPILSDRLTDDTRSWAEDEFYKDFQDDTVSWMFGRGSLGEYYSPTYGMRGVIETGYLHLVLKGGLIEAFLFTALIVYATLKGWFCSKVKIVNAMSLFLLIQLPFMYMGSPVDYNLNNLAIWICVGCCCNKRMRKGLMLPADIKF